MLLVLPVAAVGALLAAGCGSGSSSAPDDTQTRAKAGSAQPSVLVVDGAPVDASGTRAHVTNAAQPRARATAPPRRSRVPRERVRVEEWPAPALLPDGSIDEGVDPFGSAPVQVQPLPIEDDPSTTAAIDTWSTKLRRVDTAQWARWMAAGANSPWSQGADPMLESLVKVTVERCGGARTVATGVVLANETVVTTVHAVESPAIRVRISRATGSGARIPAMIRYLDVDDEVAVLKVPGLKAKPMRSHVASGDTPQWGYAYGVGVGGVAGTIRRTPAVVAMRSSPASVEQPDGLGEQISERQILPLIGAVAAGYSGGVVTASADPNLVKGWGFQGLLRARVPFRADTGGIAVPAPVVAEAVAAASRLDEWYEHRAGACPQWHR